MLPTISQIAAIAQKPVNDNMRSVLMGLTTYGQRAGLDVPHRLAQYFAQLSHESMEFKYDQEIASGKAYEGRKDLGNTQPGDGVRYKGRTPGQITGRYNYTAFRDWCNKQKLNPPDFVAHPELLNTDPWEGLGFVWFWVVHDLNLYADAGDVEMISRVVNGGTNGLPDRLADYTRSALVFLGRDATDIKGFQAQAQKDGLLPADTAKVKQVDGIDGPKTRAALHLALVAIGGAKVEIMDTKAAPVVVETVVVPKGADAPGLMRIFGGLSLTGLGSFFTGIPDPLKYAIAAFVVLLIVAMIWRGEQIAQRARKVIAEIFK